MSGPSPTDASDDGSSEHQPVSATFAAGRSAADNSTAGGQAAGDLAAAGMAAADIEAGNSAANRSAAGELERGSGAAGGAADASFPVMASASGPRFLPRKRRATDSDGASEVVSDDIDSTLCLSGTAKEVPRSIERRGRTYKIFVADMGSKTRLSARGFFQRYQDKAGTKDVVVVCLICHRLGADQQLYLAQANVTNAIKHIRKLGCVENPSLSQLLHSRAAMYVANNVSGGIRLNRGSNNATIDRSMPSKTDKRSYHLEFVLMQVMSLSPHALYTNAYMRKFLSNLAGYTPPAPNTVTHHLAELYSFFVAEVRAKLARAKELYSGLPVLHLVTDLWTEEHTSTSLGSVVLRYVDPKTGDMEQVNLGVSLFTGRHAHGNINKWLIGRLLYFGLDHDDIASTTTDSGSNIRKALRQLPYP